MGQGSNAPRPSIPSRIPTSSGGGWYIAGIVVFVLLIAGLIWWKLSRPQPVAQPPVIQSVAAPNTEAPPAIDIPMPPALDAAVDAEPDAKARVVTGGDNPCAGPCTGDAPAALQSALSGAGSAARGCYERALRTDPTLAGRIVVSVRVASNGNVCSASITQNTLGSGGVSECVLGLFRGKRFPGAAGGKCVDVNVPLSFTPRENKK
jgi:hypothetical protein